MTEEERELLEKRLKESDVAAHFLNSDMGKIIKQTCDMIIDRTNYEIATSPMEEFVKPENQLAWRMNLKFYKYDLLGSIDKLAKDGFIAWQELRQSEPLNQSSQNPALKGEEDGMA